MGHWGITYLHWLAFQVRAVLLRHSGWMAWNLTLALVAVALAVWLFRVERPRTVGWWVGFGAFALFLPNAPYVLTDLIHLRWSVEAIEVLSEWPRAFSIGS